MFCSKCKTEVKEGVKFCYSCGSEIHLSSSNQEEMNQIAQGKKEQDEINDGEQQVMSQLQKAEPEKTRWNKSTMPIVIACLLIVIIVLVTVIELPEGGGTSRRGTGVTEVGFDTPEEAVIFYLEGLRDSDLNQMLSAFAIETFVENYDFEELIERVKSYHPAMDVRMPNANEFVESMNVVQRLGTVNVNIISKYLTLTQDMDFVLMMPYIIRDPEEVSGFLLQFERNLDSPDLESIEIIGFIPPESLHEFYLDEGNQMHIERHAELFGVDEIANRIVVFQMGRHQYMLFVEVGNYDGQWHLLHFGGNAAVLVGISHFHMGLLVPEEIERYFDDINIERLIVPVE